MRLTDRVRRGEPGAIARAISLIEEAGTVAERLVDSLYPHTGQALILGVTGSPGSGKSTLVDRLIARERRAGRKVAVLAVDPSSPFSGGALLGDRLRMQDHATDSGVFIRSMASRGCLGGMAAATSNAAKILDAAGFQTVFVETIGVGQTEVKVVELADIVLLVLMPATGDEIQVLKAGVMEIGDVFVINKRDLPGAEKLQAEVEYGLSFKKRRGGEPENPIQMTNAAADEGIDALAEAIGGYRAALKGCGHLERKRRLRIERELEEIMSRKILKLLDVRIDTDRELGLWIEKLYRREARPYALIDERLQELLKNTGREMRQ